MDFICKSIQQAVIDVFDTMLNLRLELIEDAGEAAPRTTISGVVGSVGMAGRINGTVYMSYPGQLACDIVSRMIGEPAADVEQPEVSDAIGELANMVAGGMKRRTAELGYQGLLVPPVVMHGDSICVDSKSAPIAIHRSFRVPGTDERLSVRFFAKIEDQST
ncbi:MAG TPA: hypothetical protein DCY13_09935 [Verrucomicrobiales bacterium]|nr:hypothetical protein [Verrucomicrobiales bacterium]